MPGLLANAVRRYPQYVPSGTLALPGPRPQCMRYAPFRRLTVYTYIGTWVPITGRYSVMLGMYLVFNQTQVSLQTAATWNLVEVPAVCKPCRVIKPVLGTPFNAIGEGTVQPTLYYIRIQFWTLWPWINFVGILI